jgi:hypothetical protein
MLLGGSIRERSWLVPTLSQSGPPGIRAHHGPEDSVVASVLGADALHPRLRARCSHVDQSGTCAEERTLMTSTDIPAIDEPRLEAFVGQAVVDMGAAISGLLLHIGERLGLYKAMAGAGPITSASLAQRTGTTTTTGCSPASSGSSVPATPPILSADGDLP